MFPERKAGQAAQFVSEKRHQGLALLYVNSVALNGEQAAQLAQAGGWSKEAQRDLATGEMEERRGRKSVCRGTAEVFWKPHPSPGGGLGSLFFCRCCLLSFEPSATLSWCAGTSIGFELSGAGCVTKLQGVALGLGGFCTTNEDAGVQFRYLGIDG